MPLSSQLLELSNHRICLYPKLLTKREIFIMAVCKQSYTITTQKQPEGRLNLYLSSLFFVLLLNSPEATVHHCLPWMSTSPSTLNYFPRQCKYEMCILYLENVFSFIRKIYQDKFFHLSAIYQERKFNREISYNLQEKVLITAT